MVGRAGEREEGDTEGERERMREWKREGEQGKEERKRERGRERAVRGGSEKDAENGRVERGGNERRLEEEGEFAEVKTWKCSMAVGNR